MPWRSKSLICCALCGLWLACPAARGQTVNVSRKRIPANPADVALQKKLADAADAVNRKDYRTAAQDYQDYLAKKPGDAHVHYNLGYAYSALARPADAKAEYERAISLDPKMQSAYQNLGLTLLKTDPASAVAPLQKAVELAPDQPEPKFLLGDAFERSGKLAEAIEQYRAAEKLDSDNFDVHFQLARALLDSGHPADAEPEFRVAVGLRPSDAEPHLGLAESLLRQKKTAAAAAEFASYLRGRPADRQARIEYATLLEQSGSYDDALAQLDQAAKRGPEDLGSLKLRAQVYFDRKQYAAAIPPLQKAKTLAPADPSIPAELGHLYIEEKQYADAARELAAALKLDPKANDVLGEFITAQYLGKNYPAALQGLDVLAQRENLSAGAWFIRGDCYDKLGQQAQALDAYQEFLRMNTNQNSDFYFEASSRVRELKRELEKKKR